MTRTTLGIVIAAFNAEAFIGATLESVRSQTFRDWACIVVDDGSTDATARVAREFAAADPRFSVLSVGNGGHCRARNLAIRAHGSDVELITVMDADDVWLAHALETLVGRARARPDCIGAHALGEFIDAAGEPVDIGVFSALGRNRREARNGRFRVCPITDDTTFATLAASSTVFPPGLVTMRQAVYESIDGYDPVSVEGDWDLLLRATRHGPLAFVDEVVIHYRRHATNFGGQPDIALHTHMTLVRAFASPLNSPAQLATLKACWRARQLEALRTHRAGLRADGAAHLVRSLLAGLRYLRGSPRAPLRARRRQRAAPTSSYRSM